MYEASLRPLKMLRTRNGLVLKTEKASNAAIPSLERLQQHCAAGGYLWEKAWAEKTTAAWDAIVAAAPSDVVLQIGSAPTPDQIKPFLQTAIRIARKPGLTTARRDHAVVAILRVYSELYGQKPPSPKNSQSATPAFIAKIEAAYQDLLPKGFGVSKSKGTMNRLIERSVPRRAP